MHVLPEQVHTGSIRVAWWCFAQKRACRQHKHRDIAQRADRMRLRLARQEIYTFRILSWIAPISRPEAAELRQRLGLTRKWARQQWADALKLIFVHWIDQYQAGDMSGYKSTRLAMSDMVKSLERDPQLESLLANRKRELGINVDSGRRLGAELAFSHGIGKGRGIGI